MQLENGYIQSLPRKSGLMLGKSLPHWLVDQARVYSQRARELEVVNWHVNEWIPVVCVVGILDQVQLCNLVLSIYVQSRNLDADIARIGWSSPFLAGEGVSEQTRLVLGRRERLTTSNFLQAKRLNHPRTPVWQLF